MASNAENASIWWRHHVLDRGQYVSTPSPEPIKQQMMILVDDWFTCWRCHPNIVNSFRIATQKYDDIGKIKKNE